MYIYATQHYVWVTQITNYQFGLNVRFTETKEDARDNIKSHEDNFKVCISRIFPRDEEEILSLQQDTGNQMKTTQTLVQV